MKTLFFTEHKTWIRSSYDFARYPDQRYWLELGLFLAPDDDNHLNPGSYWWHRKDKDEN